MLLCTILCLILSTIVLFIALHLGILLDLFPDAVTNVILSKQSLFQISKIVAVGAAASAKYTYYTYIHMHAYISPTYLRSCINIFLLTIDKVAGDVLIDLTYSPRLAIAKILLSTKGSSISMYVISMFVYIYVRMA